MNSVNFNRLWLGHGYCEVMRPAKPLPRHAELAVNMAGSMPSFLLATFEAERINTRIEAFEVIFPLVHLTGNEKTFPGWFSRV